MSLLLHGLSNPLYYYDWIYFNIPAGHQFLHYCDVVHKFSESVIVQRREELLKVEYLSQYKNMLFFRLQNQPENIWIF